GTPGSSRFRRPDGPGSDALALAIAAGGPVEADRLAEISPVARELALVRQLEPSDQLVGNYGPPAVGRHEVAAHLEVLLPGEVRAVSVRRDARGPPRERQPGRRGAERDAARSAVEADGEADGEREAI